MKNPHLLKHAFTTCACQISEYVHHPMGPLISQYTRSPEDETFLDIRKPIYMTSHLTAKSPSLFCRFWDTCMASKYLWFDLDF